MLKSKRISLLAAPDAGIIYSVLALVIFGLLLVFDASYGKASDSSHYNHDSMYFLKKQCFWAVSGGVLMYIASRISFEKLKRFTNPILFLAIAMLFAVLFFGNEVNGAMRWFKIGPISVQPSEFAKIAIVLYFAKLLTSKRFNLKRMGEHWVVPLGVIVLICGSVAKEPDLGTAIVIFGAALSVLFMSGVRKRHLLIIVTSALAVAAYETLSKPYRMERIRVFFDPWRDPFGSGFQILHSLIALGSGGIWGVGLSEGREKLYIPAASTDFIFSTFAEEIGLIGCLLLLGIFFFITYRGFEIARKSKSAYGGLIAVGMTSIISIQALINIAVVSGAIPATGVPLPFISYGGSSLLTMMVAAGLLLTASKQINEEEQDSNEDSNNGRGNGGPHIPSPKRRPSPPKTRPKRRTLIHR